VRSLDGRWGHPPHGRVKRPAHGPVTVEAEIPRYLRHAQAGLARKSHRSGQAGLNEELAGGEIE